MNYNINGDPNADRRTVREARSLSQIGAVLYSVLSTVAFMLGAVCMRTDGAAALYCFYIPILYIAGTYMSVALLVHDRLALYLASAVSSVLCGFVLTGELLHSVLCLTAYVGAYVIYRATRERHFTFSGNICLSAACYGVSFLLILCSLCYEKYGAVSAQTLVHAYETFTEVMMTEPRATLGLIQDQGEEFAAMADTYGQLLGTLDQLLDLLLYSVPSIFICICAIGGFITVISAKRHRRMLCLPDTVGHYGITVTSAVIYIAAKILMIFVDPMTPLGITVVTVCAPLELGLALCGVLFGIAWVKKNRKSRGYYVGAIILMCVLPGLCTTLFAYLGAYSTVLVYRVRRMLERAIGEGHRRDDGDDGSDGDGEE